MARPTEYTKELGKMSLIYSLSDEGGIRYIGQTKIPQKRFRQHQSIAQNRGKTKLNKWLYKLLNNNDKPIIKIIEFTDKLDKQEKYWIKFYRDKGVDLLNMTDGGFDYKFLRKKKLSKPWGKSLSPIQYRLKTIQEVIKMNKRLGKLDKVRYFEDLYKKANEIIINTGKDNINNKLWLQYGR